MINRLLTCFFILSCAFRTAYGIQPSQLNLNDRYNPDRHLSVKHQVVDEGDRYEIWMEVTLHRKGETLQAYTIIKENLKSYADNLSFADTLSVADVTYSKTDKQHILKWSVTKSEAPGLLFFIFDHKSLETNYYHDILLDENFVVLPTYITTDSRGVPLFDSWLARGESFSVRGADTTLQGIRYGFEFPPADPPMKTDQGEVASTMKIDSSFALRTGVSVSLDREALYYFRTGEENRIGASLRLENAYYPRARTLDAVIGPLIYISTSMERTMLTETLDKKQALDNFLLDVTRSEERGKWLMKNYFRHVTEANSLFTTYKEGWKTDQGMVYILYGQPDEVYRTAKGEEWVYEKTEEISKIRFTFARVKNPYTNRHFVLLRSKSYERPWFTNVDLWRKARKDL